MAGRAYRGNPHWIIARYGGTCSGQGCEARICKGDRVFYYPKGKHLFAEPCGHAEDNAQDFESHSFDEAMATGNW